MTGSDITLRSRDQRIINMIANAGHQHLQGNVDWFQECKNYVNSILVNSKNSDIVDTFIVLCDRVGANIVKAEIEKHFKTKLIKP